MHMLSALRAGARRHSPLLAPSARRPAYLALTRAMSSTAPKRQQFLVYAPDKTDEGAFQRRLDVRTQVSLSVRNNLAAQAQAQYIELTDTYNHSTSPTQRRCTTTDR